MRAFILPLAWLHLSSTLLLLNGLATNVYIVYMGARKHDDVDQITKSHYQMLSSAFGCEGEAEALEAMIYSYRHGFSGFAAKMTESQAKYFQELPEVVKVFPNYLYEPQTTRSWDYLNFPASSATNILHDANQGDGAIIGILDSGVWPESPSFNDAGLGPIPSKWKGSCQPGQEFDPSTHCNRKLIGARYFRAGLPVYSPTEDYDSPRDKSGHGTHTASTAAGSFIDVGGLAPGTARGGAPKARVAIYKVSWIVEGKVVITAADTLAAFDQAIHDGVDVLSLSIGKSFLPLYPEIDRQDIIYYGTFHAAQQGIVSVCAAGNSGPLSQTVSNVAPWVITVAASTMDRSFPNPIILGNGEQFSGQGMYIGGDTGAVDFVFLEDRFCEDITASDYTWVAGKIVLCFTNNIYVSGILSAAQAVADARGLGIIEAINTNPSSKDLSSGFPTLLVSYQVGTLLLNYIRSTSAPKVQLKHVQRYQGIKTTAYIASFSSRGPNSLSPSVLKPDIAAPGVDILAAVPGAGLYDFMSGTSMSCPHVAGITLLLKILHPNWSPAAIKSAIITTASTNDPYTGEPIYARGEIPRIADHFDYGGGLINANAARDPGLVFHAGVVDYFYYLCAMGYPEIYIKQFTGVTQSCPTGLSVLDLNLPSITIPNLIGSVTVTRIVTNVGDPNSNYEADIVSPFRTTVSVNPTSLAFSSGVETLAFTVTITSSHITNTEYYFGSLTWRDNHGHRVKIPISVKTEFPLLEGDEEFKTNDSMIQLCEETWICNV